MLFKCLDVICNVRLYCTSLFLFLSFFLSPLKQFFPALISIFLLPFLPHSSSFPSLTLSQSSIFSSLLPSFLPTSLILLYKYFFHYPLFPHLHFIICLLVYSSHSDLLLHLSLSLSLSLSLALPLSLYSRARKQGRKQ